MDYFSISIGAAANVFSLTPLTRQSNAKQQYLLTDRDLSKLGSISKENPRHKDWQPMKLFLESQVIRASRDKFGTEDDLEERRDEVVRKRILKRQSRRIDKQLEDERKEKRLKRVRERVQKMYNNEGEGEGEGVKKKEIAEVEVEEL